MKKRFFFILLSICINFQSEAQESRELAVENPDAIIDLRTKAGMAMVKSEWRYSDAEIVDDQFGAPGPSKDDPLKLYPTGEKMPTWNISPHAGATDYNDTHWDKLDPTTLEERRAPGRLCFNWYRINVTIPSAIDGFDPTGSTVVFEIVIDDYSEIWVDGKLNKTFGQSGNGMIKGFNARNRVFLTDNAKPGQSFQIAVFGINGPMADIPDNYIWIRSATLDFHKEYNLNKGWSDICLLYTSDAADE